MTDPEPFLEGVRILDFSQYLSGPSCTRLLVELGADVIKVELAPDGDPTRGAEPRRNGRSGVWAQQNRGKRSLCIDIRNPAGLELIKRLVAEVDVVVENYTPGVMARRGLGYDDLAAINPRIVLASISGFGQTGPLRDQTCFDFIAQAYSGIMHMTGEADGPPTFVGLGMGDGNAGVHAFAAIGFALFRRDRTGRGTHIDISMLDALFHMHEYAVVASALSDGAIEPHRQGGHYQPRSPAGRFRGPKGWIVLLCTDRQLDGLWAAMGQPHLADDPRFSTPAARLENRDALTAAIESWMATFATDDEVLAVLVAHRVPAGPVLSPVEAAAHPHFVERGMVRTLHDPIAGTLQTPGNPIRYSDSPPAPDLMAPTLGQHNRDVLSGLLGLEEADISLLEDNNVILSEFR